MINTNNITVAPRPPRAPAMPPSSPGRDAELARVHAVRRDALQAAISVRAARPHADDAFWRVVKQFEKYLDDGTVPEPEEK